MSDAPAAAPRPDDRPLSLRDRVKVATLLFLFGWILRLLTWSWRLRIGAGEEHLRALLAAPRPVIVAAWHESLLIGSRFLRDHLAGNDMPVVTLVSRSADGELLARVAASYGFEVVRGSTSRGALQAARQLHRTVTRRKLSVGLAPDGPRGPARRCQAGVPLLSRLSNAPILPLGVAADRAWRLGSWDRMIVPKPFSRITVTIGEPISVPSDPAASELRDEADKLAIVLDNLSATAESVV